MRDRWHMLDGVAWRNGVQLKKHITDSRRLSLWNPCIATYDCTRLCSAYSYRSRLSTRHVYRPYDGSQRFSMNSGTVKALNIQSYPNLNSLACFSCAPEKAVPLLLTEGGFSRDGTTAPSPMGTAGRERQEIRKGN